MTADTTSASGDVSTPADGPHTVHILGTRGVPANHGGFETAAEHLALFLVARGWRVVVYCQVPGTEPISRDVWKGIERVHVPARVSGPVGTVIFDAASNSEALRSFRPGDVCLTFGYNTGFLNLAQAFRGMPSVINMDGMEWRRSGWSLPKRAFLFCNERLAGHTADLLIGDHPEISRYLSRHFNARKVTTVAYGGRRIDSASEEPLQAMQLQPGGFATVICRPVSENSVLEIVKAWSLRPRDRKLVVLGKYEQGTRYHQAVRDAAGPEVVFPGAIYDANVIAALRFHSIAYLHGHTVGGTNPSLVEALGASTPVIAHDNVFNRWVAGPGARYFTGVQDLDQTLEDVIRDPSARDAMSRASAERFEAEFSWERIGAQYEAVLRRALAARQR